MSASRTVTDFNSRSSYTAGIQEAIDDLPSSGGVVFLPAGIYRLKRRVDLREGVSLKGEGAASVISRPRQIKVPLKTKTRKNSNRVELKSTAGYRVGDELYLRDEKLKSYNAAHGIITEVTKHSIRWDLLESNPDHIYKPSKYAFACNWFPALFIKGKSRVSIQDLVIQGETRQKRHLVEMGDFTCAAIHCMNASDLRIQNVSIYNWPGDGISIQNGSGNSVRDCIIEKACGHGLHPGTGTSDTIWVNNISRHNKGDGFFFCMSVKHAICQGNLLTDNARNGIGGLSNPDRYNVVSDNVCAFNGCHGIDAQGAIGNTIRGNICRNNSQSQKGAFAGIFLSNHRENIIKDNLCIDDQIKQTQLIGVKVSNPAGENILGENHDYDKEANKLLNRRAEDVKKGRKP